MKKQWVERKQCHLIIVQLEDTDSIKKLHIFLASFSLSNQSFELNTSEVQNEGLHYLALTTLK